MAKYRIVNTRFWDDSYIARLSPNEKLLFLYLLTNPLTTIAGVYELPLKRVAFDTGLLPKEISALFSKLESDGKLVRQNDWIGIINFIKHQSLNPKVRQGIIAELERAPRELIARLPAFGIGFDSLSHSNTNSNLNPNSNSNSASSGTLSTGHQQEAQEGIRQLVNRWRIKH